MPLSVLLYINNWIKSTLSFIKLRLLRLTFIYYLKLRALLSVDLDTRFAFFTVLRSVII